eukprot:474934-Amphidinium_carterae.1
MPIPTSSRSSQFQIEMQGLRSRFSEIDGKSQTLQKEINGLGGKPSQAPSTEIVTPTDAFQMLRPPPDL